MKVVVIIQTSEKVNDIVSVLKKRSKVFDDISAIYEITDWADSFVNRVGDIKFIPLDE